LNMRGAPLQTREEAEQGYDRDLELRDTYNLGRKHERERCANVADQHAATLTNGGAINACRWIARNIREYKP
jgi:hypothetical protein